MTTKEYLTQEDTANIEKQAECLRDKLLIRLLRRSGCRVTEILRLEEHHVDFQRELIRIEHQKQVFKISCPHCGKRLAKKDRFCPNCSHPVSRSINKALTIRHLRKIPMDKDTLKLIQTYINQGGVKEISSKRMLFHISRQQAYKIVVDCASRAGITGLENPENEKQHHVSPHKFRDAWVINAMQNHPTFDDARLIQEMVGHKNINTTLRYRKVALTELKKFNDELLKEEKP